MRKSLFLELAKNWAYNRHSSKASHSLHLVPGSDQSVFKTLTTFIQQSDLSDTCRVAMSFWSMSSGLLSANLLGTRGTRLLRCRRLRWLLSLLSTNLRRGLSRGLLGTTLSLAAGVSTCSWGHFWNIRSIYEKISVSAKKLLSDS